MKQLFFFLALVFVLNVSYGQIRMQKSVSTSVTQAQAPKVYMNATTREWTEWATDGILKARCRVVTNSATQKDMIQLQVVSSQEGMCDFTANVCSDSPKGTHGWQRVKLYKDKPATLNFDKNETCNNGWWWWFRNFQKAVRID